MRNSWVLLVFLLASCGQEQIANIKSEYEFSKAAIINGEVCQAGEYPASVEIFVDAFADMGPFGLKHVTGLLCGGTLIRKNTVLTAAHCLDEEEVTQGFGKLLRIKYAVSNHEDLEWFRARKRIPKDANWAKSWIKHENYKPPTESQLGVKQSNDIALLFLEDDFDTEPAKLISTCELEEISENRKVSIVGWGQQSEGRDPEDSGRRSRKICAQTRIQELGEFEMQIGFSDEQPRKCYGDSGGASYIRLKNNELRLIGITSHSYDKNQCENAGVDTRVDKYLEWIELNLAENGRIKHGL